MDFGRLCRDLREAIKSNDIKTVHEIHSKNPELLNHPDNRDLRSLLLLKAETCNNDEFTKLIVNFGNEIDLEEHLYYAIYIVNVRLVKFLLVNGAKFESHKLMRHSMFYNFFSRTNTETQKDMLKLLLEYGLDVSQCGSIFHQFILYTQKFDESALEIAEMLVSSGAPLDEVDSFGFSPLHRATFRRKIELVEFLIKRGANVNKKSKYSTTFPLYLAVLFNNVDLINLLLRNGANINEKTIDGCTVLHRACFRNSKQIINLLIRRGSDISVEDNYGRTPFSLLDNSDAHSYERSVTVMVKEFAKLPFKNLEISEKDMDLIKKNLKANELFEKCTNDLNQMFSTEFCASFSYYSILGMAQKELVNLIRNQENVAKFEADSSRFPSYQKNLQNILRKAVEYRDKSEADSSDSPEHNHYRRMDSTDGSESLELDQPKKYRKVDSSE